MKREHRNQLCRPDGRHTAGGYFVAKNYEIKLQEESLMKYSNVHSEYPLASYPISYRIAHYRNPTQVKKI
jgi:hypothetical protein